MESLDPANLRSWASRWNLAEAVTYTESLSRLRKHGLAVYGTFVFGYDNDDADRFDAAFAFATRAKALPGRVQPPCAVSRARRCIAGWTSKEGC